MTVHYLISLPLLSPTRIPSPVTVHYLTSLPLLSPEFHTQWQFIIWQVYLCSHQNTTPSNSSLSDKFTFALTRIPHPVTVHYLTSLPLLSPEFHIQWQFIIWQVCLCSHQNTTSSNSSLSDKFTFALTRRPHPVTVHYLTSLPLLSPEFHIQWQFIIWQIYLCPHQNTTSSDSSLSDKFTFALTRIPHPVTVHYLTSLPLLSPTRIPHPVTVHYLTSFPLLSPEFHIQ